MSQPLSDSTPDPKPESKTDGQQTPTDQDPPWGSDFDPSKAWNTIKSLREIEKTHKSQLAQGAADREELERLRNEKLSADERAVKEAKEQAAAEAKTASDAEWSAKYLTSELKGIAAGVIRDDKELESFMELVDPKKFATADGGIDKDKLMGHLTALYVGRGGTPPQWGQYSAPGQPPQRPGEQGRTALEKRHGVKNSS